jgi:hypothetical protein
MYGERRQKGVGVVMQVQAQAGGYVAHEALDNMVYNMQQ